ncbi:ABC transporter permease [Congregibacter litoralis]|uniref:Putative ABC-type transport system involved in lysophospholipase L1 biosynthesis n=1 Tax=Congregibacter litoralis KT71 TaxID=314285 RepID=A4A3N7_9GAMM|nr:FtsX-like permease family protein [Congregibacter litoralis]EAQ99310.2 putative ABC-type transport system involved in lysophospholipase L1 biosynthesis [Congregibacter litoralis KT71]
MTLLLRMLVRDWRGGELGVLLGALVLAVTMVSGISGFASALKAALRQESHSFLAADLVVRDARPLPAAWLEEAADRGMESAQTLSFRSMVFAGEEGVVLASVKAVSDEYPLRGALKLSDTPFGELREHRGAPPPGSVWIEPRLFALLDLDIGDTVGIGEADFRVAAAIRGEPDRAGGFLGVGPRVMLNTSDIPATQVVQPGSRVSYRQLFAGEADAAEAFGQWLEAAVAPGQRLQNVETSQPAVGRALARAERFLLLAGSLAVILASVAVGLAARRYAERHQNYVALLKSLGADSRRVKSLYAATLALTWLIALVLGWFLAWILQVIALQSFAEQLTVVPSLFQPRPYFIGAVTALVCVIVFAWPSLGRLTAISPLRVLRSDMPLHHSREPGDYLLGLAAVLLLMWWYSADLQLTLIVLGGLLAVIVIGGLVALSLLRGGRALGMQAGSVWRLALASLQRHGLGNALQLVVFAVAIMLLLLLGLLRTSLLEGWQQQVPEGAPNHFLLNLAPEELGSVSTLLDDREVKREKLYPMLRGRLMGIAGEPLPMEPEEEDGPSQREANLTWSAALPDGNEIVEGRWWEPGETAAVSVEAEFAQRYGMSVGDTLSFRIGAAELAVTVTSLRTLDWESFKPNFFMVFPPGLLEDYPVTYMTSFYLPPEQKSLLNELLRQHPTATVLEIDAIMAQLRSTLAQVSTAIELVLSLVLLAGVLVLIAGVQATADSRLRESALLRALGAGRSHILGSVAIEFITLGVMAGVLAIVAAEGAFWALQRFVLELPYTPTPGLWLPTLLAAAVLIGGLGLWNCRRVVSVAPAEVLRDA